MSVGLEVRGAADFSAGAFLSAVSAACDEILDLASGLSLSIQALSNGKLVAPPPRVPAVDSDLLVAVDGHLAVTAITTTEVSPRSGGEDPNEAGVFSEVTISRDKTKLSALLPPAVALVLARETGELIVDELRLWTKCRLSEEGEFFHAVRNKVSGLNLDAALDAFYSNLPLAQAGKRG